MLVVAALSTGQKIGLASVGGAFILFALLCSFVLPRRNPNFPGKHVGWFTVASIAFFVAMLSAVLVFGKEKKETAGAAEATTTAAQTTTAASTTPQAPPQGDPAAGKSVFASAGCSGCHTLKAAGATGTIGPNLDQLKPPYARIVLQVQKGGKIMPSFKGSLSDTQIHNVAAFVFASTHA